MGVAPFPNYVLLKWMAKYKQVIDRGRRQKGHMLSIPSFLLGPQAEDITTYKYQFQP